MKIPNKKNILFTENEFNIIYNNHLPAKWLIFIFKYFSKETEKKDLKLSNTIMYILLTLFLIGFSGTILQLSQLIILWSTLIFSGIIAIISITLFLAFIVNNRRIKKIIKELNCTTLEYNNAVDLWKNN